VLESSYGWSPTGPLPRPKRTFRFVWGPEVEGTMAYLSRHPEIRKGLRANIHMDMVGGDPFKNKSIFHVTATHGHCQVLSPTSALLWQT